MVDFGVRLPHNEKEFQGVSPEYILKCAQLAEELKFDSVWVHDHIISGHTILDPIAVWGFVASATKKVKLGSSGLQMALRHPVWTARELASLDVLSNGRLIVGVVPGRREKEFEAAGVPLSEAGKRTDEGIKIMKALWTQRDASFSGRYHKFEKITMIPHPIQKPHPPIYIGGDSPAGWSRVARLGDGWIIGGGLTPSELAQRFDGIRKKAKEKGRDPDKIALAYLSFAAILAPGAGDKETMRKWSQDRIAEGRPRPDDVNLIGEPGEIIKKLEGYVDVGVNSIELRFMAPNMDAVLTSMKVFSREVMPSFK